MKKTTTSQCLLDLDDTATSSTGSDSGVSPCPSLASSTSDSELSSSSSSSSSSASSTSSSSSHCHELTSLSREESSDYFFGCGPEELSYLVLPMTKHRRVSLSSS
ncbi:hypothetical protein ACHAXH_004059 [Discostella pseudostelligera]